MEDVFCAFLVNFVSAGHTVDTGGAARGAGDAPAINELDDLTHRYLFNLNPECFFSMPTVQTYLDYLNDHMSNLNRHFFCFRFNKWRYIMHLENYLRQVIRDQLG